MPEFVEEDERREKCAAAATERRDVWMSAVVASIGAGRHPTEACCGADEVLRGFDTAFPGLINLIHEWAEDHDTDDDTDDDTDE